MGAGFVGEGTCVTGNSYCNVSGMARTRMLEARVRLEIEFEMASPTDYLLIVDATRRLGVLAARLGLSLEDCSLATSFSTGYGSVAFHYDHHPIDPPEAPVVDL